MRNVSQLAEVLLSFNTNDSMSPQFRRDVRNGFYIDVKLISNQSCNDVL